MPVSDNPPEAPDTSRAIWKTSRLQWKEGGFSSGQDALVMEEPLEIQIQGHSMAVLMRTPGHDEDLIRGFLLTEGLARNMEDIRRIQTCTTVPFPEAEDNVFVVTLAPDWDGWRGKERQFYASSSCGICGKGSIESISLNAPKIKEPLVIHPSHIQGLSSALRAGQHVFEKTGGCHGAGLMDALGGIHLFREDVGRHNAVDKVIGAAAKEGIPFSKRGLFVSGRVSFEIVQKAAMVGIPWVGGVSAPSSLAAQTAHSLGMTLVGFCREDRFTQYTPVPMDSIGANTGTLPTK